jgi:hypothetical protein
VYTSTENADGVQKDAYYDQLQDTLNDIPSHDEKLLIGDMNTQVGNNRCGLEHAIDRHGSGAQTNDNGERLLFFCRVTTQAQKYSQKDLTIP